MIALIVIPELPPDTRLMTLYILLVAALAHTLFSIWRLIQSYRAKRKIERLLADLYERYPELK